MAGHQHGTSSRRRRRHAATNEVSSVGVHLRDHLKLHLDAADTVGVMQTADAIARVALERADAAATGSPCRGPVCAGVVHGHVMATRPATRPDAQRRRRVPDRHPGAGDRHGQADRSLEIADLALRFRDRGVVGFDIAGPEAGYPPSLVADAFHRLVHASFHLTIHAGEGYGLPSIREALELGAERLGHGVRIVDDITVGPDGRAELGLLAAYVRDRRIPLELARHSNVHTGLAHPWPSTRSTCCAGCASG